MMNGVTVEMNTTQDFPELQFHPLHAGKGFFATVLPVELLLSAAQFNTLWNLHPSEFPEIKMHGRVVKIPRWQQAYGADYRFSGQVSKALPIPELLTPLIVWAKNQIDGRLNGMLLNWYNADLGHYIGRHRDSTASMICGAPIVTISFGESRLFRLRPWRENSGNLKWDFIVKNGSIILIPFETNLAFTHEIARSCSDRGRRISVTLRAFETNR
jgi:alkylated DNA repair dioxygenase AlkB